MSILRMRRGGARHGAPAPLCGRGNATAAPRAASLRLRALRVAPARHHPHRSPGRARARHRTGATRYTLLEHRTVCSSGGAFLGALDRLEVEDGSVPPHIEEILARAAI